MIGVVFILIGMGSAFVLAGRRRRRSLQPRGEEQDTQADHTPGRWETFEARNLFSGDETVTFIDLPSTGRDVHDVRPVSTTDDGQSMLPIGDQETETFIDLTTDGPVLDVRPRPDVPAERDR
jgi:hypothetical protein